MILEKYGMFVNFNKMLVWRNFLFFVILGGEFLLNYIKNFEDGRCYF